MRCLSGLKNSSNLDPACPNYQLHRAAVPTGSDKHPITVETLQTLITKDPATDFDEIWRVRRFGRFFRISVLPYGYVVLGRGGNAAIVNHRPEDQEIAFNTASNLQGHLIPVFLGLADWPFVALPGSGIYKHIYLLSWPGSPTAFGRSPDHLVDSAVRLRDLGFKNIDLDERNVFWNKEIDRPILLDIGELSSRPSPSSIPSSPSSSLKPFPFMRLPPELRFRVLVYTVAWLDWDLDSLPTELRHSATYSRTQVQGDVVINNIPNSLGRPRGTFHRATSLPIMRVNRQFRMDALKAFYLTNSFVVAGFRELAWFLTNGGRLRLNNIRELKLVFHSRGEWHRSPDVTRQFVSCTNVFSSDYTTPTEALGLLKDCTALQFLHLEIGEDLLGQCGGFRHNLRGFDALCAVIPKMPALRQIRVDPDVWCASEEDRAATLANDLKRELEELRSGGPSAE